MGYYDTAQICLNGHLINSCARSSPEFNSAYCKQCGAATVSSCAQCRSIIRGYFHVEGAFDCSDFVIPLFCHACGAPYPWTIARLEAAKDLLEELGLDVPEKTILEGDLSELLKDTAQSQAAAVRLSRFLEKAKPAIIDAFKTLLSEAVSQSVRKILGWQLP